MRLESDAPDGYLGLHKHARLVLTSEPSQQLRLDSFSDFRGGRSRLVVRCADTATAGDEGTLTIFFFTPTERQFNLSVKYKIINPDEENTAGNRGKAEVQAPEPVAVRKDEWDEFGWDATSVAEVREEDTDVQIYVNVDNQHLAKLLQSGGYQEQGLSRMRGNYILYVAYYAWLQHHHLSSDDHGLSGEEFENYRSAELDRASQTVIHSISATSRLDDE